MTYGDPAPLAGWVTNDPTAAARRRAADAAYESARAAASSLPLAEKVVAYRHAAAERRAIYDAVVGPTLIKSEQ